MVPGRTNLGPHFALAEAVVEQESESVQQGCRSSAVFTPLSITALVLHCIFS